MVFLNQSRDVHFEESRVGAPTVAVVISIGLFSGLDRFMFQVIDDGKLLRILGKTSKDVEHLKLITLNDGAGDRCRSLQMWQITAVSVILFVAPHTFGGNSTIMLALRGMSSMRVFCLYPCASLRALVS